MSKLVKHHGGWIITKRMMEERSDRRSPGIVMVDPGSSKTVGNGGRVRIRFLPSNVTILKHRQK